MFLFLSNTILFLSQNFISNLQNRLDKMTSLDKKISNFSACINAFLFIVQQLFLAILSFYGNEIRSYCRQMPMIKILLILCDLISRILNGQVISGRFQY